MSNNYYSRSIRPADTPVTARQVSMSQYSEARGDDEGIFLCKAVYPYYDFGEDGKKGQTQAGWSYHCQVPARDNLSIFVKVNDMTCIVSDEELKKGPVKVQFSGFRGVWWVNKRGFQELSCKAEMAERVTSAEVAP